MCAIRDSNPEPAGMCRDSRHGWRLLNLGSTEADEEIGTFRELGCVHRGRVSFSWSYQAVRTTNDPRLSEQTGAFA